MTRRDDSREITLIEATAALPQANRTEKKLPDRGDSACPQPPAISVTGRHAPWSIHRVVHAVERCDRKFVPRSGHRSVLPPVPPIASDCPEEWRYYRRVPVMIVNFRCSSGVLLSLGGVFRGGLGMDTVPEIRARDRLNRRERLASDYVPVSTTSRENIRRVENRSH
jgi:hypothetical protein